MDNLQGMFSTFTVGALRMLLMVSLRRLPYQFDSDTSPLLETYDFVVVGAGCAGSVVAGRLSETGASVLLLEAGGSEPPESSVPGFTTLMYAGDRDWNVKGKAQKNAQLGYNGNASNLIAGRMMGGSTSLNGVIYVRGNKEDYNNWARLGNTGWSYDEVLPYFMKSEDFRGLKTSYTDRYHGKGGPLSVQAKLTNTKLLGTVAKAALELGYNVIDDSGPSQIGFAPLHVTVKDGVRASSSQSFLLPPRKNLRVQTKATVTRIVFDENKRAVGVLFTLGNELKAVRVSREVIISAGGLFTPKLLMLSGVGPVEHLSKQGISIVSAVEGVGQNLQDHPNVYLPFAVRNGGASSLLALASLTPYVQYMRDQTGILADCPGGEMNAWIKVDDGSDDPTWGDIQLLFQAVSFAYDGGSTMARSIGMKNEVFNDVYGPLVGRESIAISVSLARPKSRGLVTLRSPDFKDPPVVDINFLDHPDDMDIMIKGIKFALSVANSRAVQTVLDARQPTRLLRPCAQYGNRTDAYWKCYVRYTINTHWHYSGTAKMAPDTDPLGVVSPRLNVRGVSGLRVIDASIMPQVVAGNTMAATYMIGEKGADFIKQDWGYNVDNIS